MTMMHETACIVCGGLDIACGCGSSRGGMAMGRDHSVRCPMCGLWTGGFFDLCDCPKSDAVEQARRIAELACVWRMSALAACIHAAAVEEMRCRVGARRAYNMVRAALAERNIFIRSWTQCTAATKTT